MIAKIWKKALLLVLIIACLFNVINKIVHKASLKEEVSTSAQYIEQKFSNNQNN